MFSKETYIGRRNELKRAMGSGLLLFFGNEESAMNYEDNTYMFRQDSTFSYYFGLDYAGLAAVIDIDNDEEIIFGNELTIDDFVWMGTQPTMAEKSESVGVGRSMALSQLASCLRSAITSGRKVHFLPPYRPEHKLKIAEYLGISPAAQKDYVSVEFVKAVVNMRNHKTDEEIAEITKAVDVSTLMHLTAYRMARPGVHECEIAAAVEKVAGEAGCRLAFPTIATSHGHVLHNHGFVHTLKEGDIFLLDAGAETALHYAGDLSSSCPVSGRFTERQETIYNIHLDSFNAAVEAIKPGVAFREVHLAAATKVVEGMKSLGMMKGDAREAAEIGAYALFFPCGVGHMMGLDVHDLENLGEQYVGYPEGVQKSTQFGFKSLRLARPLEKGFVFTVEPGIYFMPELIDKWHAEKQFAAFINYDEVEKWRGFSGLRNELDYMITDKGAELMGTIRKPMTISEVYDAMNK